jgi:gliding motility-associated-like protein
MNLFREYKTLILACIIGLIGYTSTAQIFYNNGATVSVNPGAVLQANGGVENASSGQMTNNGSLYASTSGAPGNLTLSGTAITQGNGKYFVEQDFINNASFTQNNSEVIMKSTIANQLITGTQSTTFHKLTLPSAGTPGIPKVSLTLNASIDSMLNLNDRELATNVNTLFILSPDTSIVKNTITAGSEGFISSLAPGTLSRNSNVTSNYRFPVGSSITVRRYRPVDIKPNSVSPNTYTVRFVNHNADNDGFLRSINDGLECIIIDTFYHAINRSAGSSPADIKLYYIPLTDGNWSNIANWQTGNNQWNDLGNINSGVSGIFSTLVHASWPFANPGDPYALSVVFPAKPTITCPATVCHNNPTGSFSAISATQGATFNWVAPAGSSVVTGQGTNAVNVLWNSPGQYIYVQASTSFNGHTCLSKKKDSCTVVIAPPPIPSFTETVNTLNELEYGFHDLTVPAASAWNWNFGDGSNSNIQNPDHIYAGPGTYHVILTITQNGCIGSDTLTFVKVDYNEFLIVPNVFSPDGNNINDNFLVNSKSIKDLSVDIFNRWGKKMFSSDKVDFQWNGKDPEGKDVTDGTYFYVLKATSYIGKAYNLKGYISLFREL